MHYKFFESDNVEGFALLDRVVEWSKQEGLYVILDLHAAPGGQTGANIDDSSCPGSFRVAASETAYARNPRCCRISLLRQNFECSMFVAWSPHPTQVKRPGHNRPLV